MNMYLIFYWLWFFFASLLAIYFAFDAIVLWNRLNNKQIYSVMVVWAIYVLLPMPVESKTKPAIDKQWFSGIQAKEWKYKD